MKLFFYSCFITLLTCTKMKANFISNNTLALNEIDFTEYDLPDCYHMFLNQTDSIKDTLVVFTYSCYATIATCTIKDINGNLINELKFNIVDGLNKNYINVKNLGIGIYMIKVHDGLHFNHNASFKKI